MKIDEITKLDSGKYTYMSQSGNVKHLNYRLTVFEEVDSTPITVICSQKAHKRVLNVIDSAPISPLPPTIKEYYNIPDLKIIFNFIECNNIIYFYTMIVGKINKNNNTLISPFYHFNQNVCISNLVPSHTFENESIENICNYLLNYYWQSTFMSKRYLKYLKVIGFHVEKDKNYMSFKFNIFNIPDVDTNTKFIIDS